MCNIYLPTTLFTTSCAALRALCARSAAQEKELFEGGFAAPNPHVAEQHIMAKLTLDLHDIYNHSGQIDKELNRIVQEAIAKRIALVEIIPGKGSGQLKKHVLRFLNQSHIRTLYHRIEKDDRNFGRIFIHFRH
jgi:Smr domain